MDPISLIMLAMIGLLIIFMVRNGRKRREMMSQLQDGTVPGAKVMLQSGIYGTIESIDGEDMNRITISSGSSTLVVHRNAIGQIIPDEPVVEETEESSDPSEENNAQ